MVGHCPSNDSKCRHKQTPTFEPPERGGGGGSRGGGGTPPPWRQKKLSTNLPGRTATERGIHCDVALGERQDTALLDQRRGDSRDVARVVDAAVVPALQPQAQGFEHADHARRIGAHEPLEDGLDVDPRREIQGPEQGGSGMR